MDETEDDFLGGRLRLIQPRTGYRIGSDSILLAATVQAKPEERVLDIGCGSGAIALALAQRLPEVRVDGLELQAELFDIACRNVVLNGLEQRVRIIAGDLAQAPRALDRNSYDHIMTNPPYLAADNGTVAPPNSQKAVAHVAGAIDLRQWLQHSLKFLKPFGWIHIIQRADRLADVLSGLDGKAGDITICPLWPAKDLAAKRVIVRARKGGRGALTVHPGIVLHHDGQYTPVVEHALRHGNALSLDQQ